MIPVINKITGRMFQISPPEGVLALEALVSKTALRSGTSVEISGNGVGEGETKPECNVGKEGGDGTGRLTESDISESVRCITYKILWGSVGLVVKVTTS